MYIKQRGVFFYSSPSVYKSRGENFYFVGIFITTSDFTKGAVEIISKQTQNKIVLVNGKQLAKLMIEYDLGVSTVATYKVKRIDSDFFNEDI